VQNPETQEWFPRRHRARTAVFPNAVIREELVREGPSTTPTGPPSALYAGRLEPWKGVFLCLHALALLPGWRLIVCGGGKDQHRLERLARRLHVADRVEWVGWLPQDELLDRMRRADVFLFPSLREEAGAVVAEARAAGLPVVCLERGGPPLLAGPAGICVPDSGGVASIARRLADAASVSMKHRRGGQLNGAVEDLLLDRRVEALRVLLFEAVPDPFGAALATGLD
jgi:glycosyltransferase involved in cell wall biosynthesis